jgi:PKD repeat protein
MAAEVIHSTTFSTTQNFEAWTPSFPLGQSGDVVVCVAAITNFTGSTSNFSIGGLEGGTGSFGWSGSDDGVWSALILCEWDDFDGTVTFSQTAGQNIEAGLLVAVVRGISIVFDAIGVSGPNTGDVSSPVEFPFAGSYTGTLIPFQSAVVYGGFEGLVAPDADDYVTAQLTLSDYPYSLSLALGPEYLRDGSSDPYDNINLLGQGSTWGTTWEWFANGYYFRETAAPPPQPPVAALTATPSSGTAPLEVTFSIGGTAEGDNPLDSVELDFGDGNTLPLSNSTVFTGFTLTISGGGVLVTSSMTYPSGTPGFPEADVDIDGLASEFVADGGDLANAVVRLEITVAGGGDFFTEQPFPDWSYSGFDTYSAYRFPHTYTTAGTYTATFTVTDVANLTDTATATVTVTDDEVVTTIDPSNDFYDALRYSHRAFTRVILRTPDCQTYELPVVDGSITIDRNSKTRRSADLTIAIDQLGTDTRDALEKITVQSGEVEIYTGVTYENGDTEEILIARMRVDSLDRQDSASARIGAYDYALMLDEHPVDPGTGSAIPAGTDWRTAIEFLIDDTFTWTPCGWTTLFAVHPDVPAWEIPEQAWDNVNRLSAIMEWAEAKECDFYNLPDGRFYLAPKTDDGEPVWTVDSGDAGVLVSATQKFSRENQYNAVAISFQVPDDTYESIRAFVVDEDPQSPTRWGGPFGKRVLTLDSIPAKDADEARSIAIRKLNENKGATRALSLTTLRNPTLLPGQVILVDHPMIRNERQVIEKVVHQLGRGTSEIDCTLSRP